MPRPKSKKELLSASADNLEALLSMVNGLEPGLREREFPKSFLNRNIRDVLAHLHHWHLLFLDWYKVGMKGQKPEIPAKGYSWKTTPDLNREIQKKYTTVPLKSIVRKLQKSHQQLGAIIQQHTEKELFEKAKYKWTGSTSLGAYLISATSSHYDWGIKLIRRALR